MTQFINSKEALVVEAIDGLLRGSGGRNRRNKKCWSAIGAK